MEVERELFISGEDVLKRWKGAPFQLVNAILSGALLPIDEESGEIFSSEINKCFFCDKDLDETPFIKDRIRKVVCYSTIEYDDFYQENITKDVYCTCGHRNPFNPEAPPLPTHYIAEISNRARISIRAAVARKSKFYLAEVETYEQAHGLGPLPHNPETPEALNETLRAAGITDTSLRAKMINAAFELPLRELGAIMTGKPDDDGNSAANIKTAQRLLGKSK